MNSCFQSPSESSVSDVCKPFVRHSIIGAFRKSLCDVIFVHVGC